jgi:hypothetical protein
MNDDSPAPAIRRLCIAVDAEHYSSLDRSEQNTLQRNFVTVMAAARQAAGLDPNLIHSQPAGDGELALLPPGIDETDVIARFIRGLRDALHARNHSTGRRLRLRVAMHTGLTELAANGYAGRAVVTAARMCESPQLKRHLAGHPHADLVLALSQSLFEDHIGHDFFDIRADAFEQLTLRVGDRFRTEAWVYVPEHRPGDGTLSAEKSTVEGHPAGANVLGPGSVQHNVTSTRAGRDHVHGNVHNNGGPR